MADSFTFNRFFERSEDNLHIAEEGHAVHVFHVVLKLLFPGDGITAVHLRKPAKPGANIVSVLLFGVVPWQVFHQKRPRPYHGHVALENVEKFGEFVEAGGAEELAVGVQAYVVGEQVPLRVTLVGHGAELDEPEYPFALARAGLRKEGVAMHLDGAEDGKHEQQRAQGENRGQRAAEVQGSFEEAGVHIG